MSQKNRKGTSKRDKKENSSTPSSNSVSLSPCDSSSFAIISIRACNFHNLQHLFDDDTKEEFEIVAKYLSEKINSTVNVSRISASVCNENSFEIVYDIRVNVSSEEEIFNICANPVVITLQKPKEEGDVVPLGHCNVDMLALLTPYTESKTYRKHFQPEASHHRKITFDCQISSDVPLLQEQHYENLLYVTIDTIHNFEEKGEITVGFKAPMNSQFSNLLTFTHFLTSPDDKTSLTSSHWFDMPQSKSNHKHQAYHFPSRFGDEILLSQSQNEMKINRIMRAILLNGKFLRNHIRRERKIAIELMLSDGNRHMIGFINAEDLLHVGRRKLQVAVPLFEFNSEAMVRECGYESAWSESKGINEEIPVLDQEGRKSFLVVKLELEKPLNEEVYENSTEDLTELNVLANDEHKVTNLRENLQVIASNLLTTETNPSKALLAAISNGKMFQIKSQLNHFVKEFAAEFGEFQANFQCKLTSRLLNGSNFCQVNDDHSKLLTAKFYQALRMEEEADEIFLQEITKNRDSEVAWLNCGVHFVRCQLYEKAAVCIDEVLRVNEISTIGVLLKEFLDFKNGKIKECVKIENFIKNPLEIVDDILSDSQELLWYSNENFLSCHDNYIKSAVIFIKLGCYDIAEECIGEYYVRHGANVNYFYLLAAIDSQRGEHQNALLHLNKIAECDVGNHNVNHTKILITVCINLMLCDNSKDAMNLFEKFINAESCDNFLLLFLIGRYYNEHGNYAKAQELLTKSSQMLRCELIFNELGKSHEKLESFEMAEKCFQEAVTCGWSRKNSEGWKNLVDLYEKQKRFDTCEFCKSFMS